MVRAQPANFDGRANRAEVLGHRLLPKPELVERVGDDSGVERVLEVCEELEIGLRRRPRCASITSVIVSTDTLLARAQSDHPTLSPTSAAMPSDHAGHPVGADLFLEQQQPGGAPPGTANRRW